MELMVNITGEDLAGVRFGERSAAEGHARLFLGIQEGKEVVDLVPVTAELATFTAVFSVSPLPDGGTNFLGPYAHGTRTARFCYLVWMAEADDGNTSRFSRIKLHLSPLRWTQIEAEALAGTPVGIRFSLRDKKGRPVCASVPDSALHWEFSR